MSPLSTVGAVAAVAAACTLAAPAPALASPAAPASALAPVSHPEQAPAAPPAAAHEPARDDPPKLSGTPGIDVSHWQGKIDWGKVADGKGCSYMKAAEGTDYRAPSFADYYTGAYAAGMIRGAYHFALPDRSSGKV